MRDVHLRVFSLGFRRSLSGHIFPKLSLEIKAVGLKTRVRFQLRFDVTGACGHSRDGQSSRVRAVPCLEVEARAASGDVRAFGRAGAALHQVGSRVLVLEGPCV